MAEIKIAVSEKYMLSVKEAAAYFNIGEKQIRRIAENERNSISIRNGNRCLIIRERFEEYINRLAEGDENKE